MKKLLFLALAIVSWQTIVHSVRTELSILNNSLEHLSQSLQLVSPEVSVKYSVACMLSSQVSLLPENERKEIEQLIRNGDIGCIVRL